MQSMKIRLGITAKLGIMVWALVLVVVGVLAMGGNQVALANSSSAADSVISVKVDKITIRITQINGLVYQGDHQLGNITDGTYTTKNTVHLRADKNARVKIVFGGKVLWHGDLVAGRPTAVEIDLGDVPLGIHSLTVWAGNDENDQHHSEMYFRLHYLASVPSILPDHNETMPHPPSGEVSIRTPSAGLYINIAGRAYSLVTLVSLGVLLAALVSVKVALRRLDQVR